MTAGAPPPRWVTADELRRALDLASLIDALESGHRRPRAVVADALIGAGGGRYLIRSATAPGGVIGSKLVTIFPDNPARERAAVQALIVLFDGSDGAPLAVLDATELTYWKTAADSGLGSKLLAREDARTLVMVGAGGLAPWLVRGHLTARPGLERVLVWNRTGERAAALAAQLRQEGIDARAAHDLAAAVAEGDIVSTATMAREPILRGDWLKPGAHVDLVGGFAPDTREADDAVLRRGKLYVDCRESALHGVGDVVQPLSAGVIAEADIRGDLYDLVGGGIGRRESARDITVYKNAGGAHLDLMVAAALLKRLDRMQGKAERRP